MSQAAHCVWSSLHKLPFKFLAALQYPHICYNKETEAQEGRVTKITQSVRDRLMARRLKLDFEVLQKVPFFLEVFCRLVAFESLQSVMRS